MELGRHLQIPSRVSWRDCKGSQTGLEVFSLGLGCLLFEAIP